jgi:L-rhamnose mutarotase
VINVWEYESMEVFAASLDREIQGKGMQDPFLEKWWAEAQPLRECGYDRLMYPASYSPSIDEVIERGIVGYRTFRHEIITTKPGKAREYIDRVEKDWLPVAKSLGMECIGAYRTAMRNDTEVLMIWAFKDYAAWGKAELALDGAPGQKWRASVEDIVTHELAHLMASAPKSPTQTGVQP